MIISGIYTITNNINNKVYVGCATNVSARKCNHFKKLRNGTHKNSHLQSAWNRYGEENFKFEIIEECENRFLSALEHYWVTTLYSLNPIYGYNIRQTHPYGKIINTKEITDKANKTKRSRVYIPSEKQKRIARENIKKRGWKIEEIENSAIKRRIPLYCINLEGEIVMEYNSAREAAIDLSLCFKQISLCINKKCGRVNFCKFIRKSEFDNKINYEYNK